MKTPTNLDPANVAVNLRERAKKAELTFRKSELRRIASILEKLASRCGEAYQVAGQLANFAEMKEDPAVVKVMDLLAWPLERGNILRFNLKRYRELKREMDRKAKAKSASKPARKKARHQSRS
jgi:hypothetical protein